MTKPDPQLSSTDEPRNFAPLVRFALLNVGGLLLVCLIAYGVGYTAGTLQDSSLSAIDAAMLSALAVAIAALAWALRRYWPASSGEPESPRVKRSRMFLYASLGVGIVLGIVMVAGEGASSPIFSNQPIGSVVAGISIAIWLIVVPIGTWLWWRSIDEHEGDAYREGAMVAGHAYLFIAPAWWMATRAGWLPPQDPMIVFLAVCAIWSAVWLSKRYL